MTVAKLQSNKIMFTQIRRRCAHAFYFSNNCSAFEEGSFSGTAVLEVHVQMVPSRHNSLNNFRKLYYPY